MEKILIIRFSSIGDIVLTTPIIRCIKIQKKAQVHYLIKPQYACILQNNPYVDKIIPFQGFDKKLLFKLKQQKYDCVIDLQNNLRSSWIKLFLCSHSYTVKKRNIAKLLLIYLNINLINDHVVDRFFLPLKKINIINDNKGLDYFIPNNVHVDFNVNSSFISWSLGASYIQKSLSVNQIVKVCNQISFPFVLLGGKDKKMMGDLIVKKSKNKNIYNFCGNLSLDQSAYLIKKSKFVLTNDTGLMHIASALNKPIISFWGCTKPILGFRPYMAHIKNIEIVMHPSYPPCSKHGSYCRINQNGCVKKINPDIIKKEISNLF